MSTNGNLPAGQFTTQINGKQCTAIPKSSSQSSAAEKTSISVAAAATISTSSAEETKESSAQVQGVQPNVSQTTFSTSTTPAAVSIAATSEVPPTSTLDPTPTPEPIPTSASFSAAAAETLTSELPALPSSSTTVSPTPASRVTTPTISSQTSVPIAQSEISTSSTPTPTSNAQNGLPNIIASQTVSSTPTITRPVQESSAASGISSNPKLEAAPVVGGVLGSIALITVIGVIFWFFRRRRRQRDTLLTPLTTRGEEKTFYEIDRGSVGATKRNEKWKTGLGYATENLSNVVATIKSGLSGFGSTLRTKVVGERSDTPSVNLNRGNSQFLDGPIPQHSRNNSVLSNPAHLTARDRLSDWWDTLKDNVTFNWRLRRQPKEPMDPFAAARNITEKQANMNGQPDFSQLLGTDERKAQGGRRGSSIPNLGSLGLDFESQNPFADPVVVASKTQNRAWVPPNLGGADKTNPNPFADPIAQPQRSVSKPRTSISDIRRSRGQSIDVTNNVSAYIANNAAYRPPSTAVGSRYPSSIAPSRDSYRDTVFSAFSSNARKGKGRSDPFDLERPELWQPITKTPPVPNNNRISTRPRGNSTVARESTSLYPDPLQPTVYNPNPTRMSSLRGNAVGQIDSNGAQPRIVSSAMPRVVSNGTYASKYSSGVSSLGDWGDPGPDLGPGSSSGNSLRGNASSNGSGDFTFGAADASAIYGDGAGVIKGSLAEIPNESGSRSNEWDNRRNRDNVSPISLESKASSRGGVGKAM